MTDDERRAEIEAVARATYPEAFEGFFSSAEGRRAALRTAERAVEHLDRVRDVRGDDEGHEGCERRGGVCDCAGRPCAVDYPDAARWERTAKAATDALVKAEDRIAELEAARSPQGEDHCTCWGESTLCAFCASQRSPQGEDHERSMDPEITAEERRARESKMLAPQGEDHEAGIDREKLARWLARRLKVETFASAYLADDLIAWLARNAPSSSRDGSVAVEDVARLVEALRPFADIADRMQGHRGESPLWAVIDECRAARDALAEFSPASIGDRTPETG